MATPSVFYQEQIDLHIAELRILTKRRSILGWLRLISMIIAITAFIWFLSSKIILLLVFFFLFAILFLYVLKKDISNNEAIENLKRLQQVNITELDVLDHRFTQLPDGSEFQPHEHEYAGDLDIFGRASLFQLINRTGSDEGKLLLASWFLKPASRHIIAERQEAVKELAEKAIWRQQLQSFSQANPFTRSSHEKIRKWMNEPSRFINQSHWKILRFVLPLISFSLLAMHLSGFISSGLFYPLIIFMLLISLAVSKAVSPAYFHLDKTSAEIESLADSISWIEKEKFQSAMLQTIRKTLFHDSIPASVQIKKLKSILDRFDLRLNPLVFLPLNTFLFWDLQQVFLLEKWKTNSGKDSSIWIRSLSETECLSSLGNLYFNHPDWTFPSITEDENIFIAKNLGHPLIHESKCVLNSFATEGRGQLNLITGSNMAGKSTFLRSVGVNQVLAMMGSAVFASSLTCSHMKVMSSMRINDNLEESTSTFYAELKKLKLVIEAASSKEKILILLDEILRGTNSADRHTGSEALIKQLIGQGSIGFIATHDLQLTGMAETFPANLHNFHFDVQVANEELFFDYKLKPGICQKMNASFLMRKIGIKL